MLCSKLVCATQLVHQFPLPNAHNHIHINIFSVDYILKTVVIVVRQQNTPSMVIKASSHKRGPAALPILALPVLPDLTSVAQVIQRVINRWLHALESWLSDRWIEGTDTLATIRLLQFCWFWFQRAHDCVAVLCSFCSILCYKWDPCGTRPMKQWYWATLGTMKKWFQAKITSFFTNSWCIWSWSAAKRLKWCTGKITIACSRTWWH